MPAGSPEQAFHLSRPGPSRFQAVQARFTKKAKQAKPTGAQLYSQNYDQVSELVR